MESWPLKEKDEIYVTRVVTQSGTSFYWGMRFLPRSKRIAMYGIYAFCRAVDDIADSFAPCQDRLQELAIWRQRIEALYQGNPDHPVTRILSHPVAQYQLAKEEFLAMIEGMEMDAREIMRWPGLEELELYCQRVAGAAGLLSTRIFGETSEAGRNHALALGHAFQLTNILRDIHQDAQRDRLYLPREDLYACGIEDAPPNEVLSDPALADVCRCVADRARQYFEEAAIQAQNCDRQKLRPARIMRSVYVDLLTALEQRGWDNIDQQIIIPGWRKAWSGLTGIWR